MKHCAKKLLGLAFALALCLAVGGTAFAVEAPEFADVPAALPEQEMLAFEPNVNTAEGTTTIDKLATEGYQVTIPTTVTFNSGEDKSELEVKASVKQLRTLKITLASDHDWNLQHESGQVLAGYSLKAKNPDNYEVLPSNKGFWTYDEDGTTAGKKKPELYLQVGQKDSGVSDITWSESFTVPMIVEVTDPSQATMSGTYTDTVSFEFDLTKQCFTYIINVYGQKVELTSAASGTSSDFGKKYKGLQAVNMAGDASAPYTEQYVLEYGINPNGTVMGAAPGPWQHTVPTVGETRKAVDDTEKTFTADDVADYALRWETLDPVTIDPATDYANSVTNGDKTKTKTINLNLVRKWYWLDVNGATDYTGAGSEESDGNQGGSISGCVNMKVSVDGQEWSNWFWQSDGDDYWGQFPYGIHFKLGLHHVKDGYVYEMSGNGVKIIANGTVDQTKPGAEESGTTGYTTTYYVYDGTLTGAPTGTDSYNNVRYCYIPCYKKGITYFANGGTGGTESVNEDNPPRANVPYDATGTLKTPADLDIEPPTDKSFLWWSTKPTYTAGTTLYKAEANVSDVNWETYTSAEMSKRPTGDTQKRELYAIWETPYTVKVQFGDEHGWTDWDEVTQSFPENKQHNDLFDYPVTLGTAYTYDNTSLTLSETENRTVWEALQAKITQKTKNIDSFARPEDVWQLQDAYTITELPANREVIIKIKRKRYLLNVIPALQNDTGGYTPASDATEAELYGIFDLESCDVLQTPGGKVSSYQSMRNYGSSYRIYNVKAKPGYRFVGFFKVPSGGGFLTQADGMGNLTGKNSGISYFKDGINTYDGDTIYVMYKKDTVTFDYNGGTTADGATKLVLNYDDTIRFPQVVLTNTNPSVDFVGWSTEKNPTGADEIFKLASEGGDVLPGSTLVSSKVTTWTNENNKVLYAVWRSTTGPNHAPAKKALTVRYHANFDPTEALALDLDTDPLLEDMDEDFGFEPDPLPEDVLDPTVDAVKTVTYKPDENVVLRHCMFKRAGYVFVGWNTEKDGTGKKYEVNGVPITDWAAGATVDLYAQWEKPHHMKPVDDSAPFVPADPDTPTERVDDGFDDAFGADPAAQPEGLDDAFGVDPAAQPEGLDDAFGVDPQPEGLDDAFGIDPDPQPDGMDDAFGIDPDPQPEELDDAFGV